MICRGAATSYCAAFDPLLPSDVLEPEDDEPVLFLSALDDSDEESEDDDSPDEVVDEVDSLPLFESAPWPFPPLRLSVT